MSRIWLAKDWVFIMRLARICFLAIYGIHLMDLCMKDRKYDKRHVRSKNHSGCLETLCHVRGPLRNKMATLGVCSDIDPSADPVPDQTMLPTVTYPEPF